VLVRSLRRRVVPSGAWSLPEMVRGLPRGRNRASRFPASVLPSLLSQPGRSPRARRLRALPSPCRTGDTMSDIFTVGVWGWDSSDSPQIYPFLAATLDRLLSRRLGSLLVATCKDGSSWLPVSRRCRERRVGHYETDGKALAIAKDALAVFWDGGCQRCTQLGALGKAAGVPTRLVRVPQGEVAHLGPVRLKDGRDERTTRGGTGFALHLPQMLQRCRPEPGRASHEPLQGSKGYMKCRPT
jgi:hypothetical protein